MTSQDKNPVVTPLPRQVTWQDFELGLVIHYDLDVFMPGGHDHERSRREVLDPELYTPMRLDTDQWLEAAHAMGARYAILTATHHQGFLQWQSDVYPFGLKQTRWRNGKADIVRDFVRSCERYGIRPGVYIGIRFNAFCQVYQYELTNSPDDIEARAQYMRVCEALVTEICTRYGEWCEIWFDGGVISPAQGGPDLLPIADVHQPEAVFYHSPQRSEHRWAGTETGTTEYPCWSTFPDTGSQGWAHRGGAEGRALLQHGDPDGSVWCPAMCDAPIRDHDWLWRPEREDRVQPLDRLVDMYYRSVGCNSNLIVGAVPDRDGLIPEPDFRRYAEFGRALERRVGQPVAESSGQGDTIVLTLPEPGRIDQVLIMEDITQGERVREYTVEGLIPGGEWQELCRGTAIGHKRIERLSSTEVAGARLRVLDSVAIPAIRRLAVFGPGSA